MMAEKVYFGDLVAIERLQGYLVPYLHGKRGYAIDLQFNKGVQKYMILPKGQLNGRVVNQDTRLFYVPEQDEWNALVLKQPGIDYLQKKLNRDTFTRESLHLWLQRHQSIKVAPFAVREVVIMKTTGFTWEYTPEKSDFWVQATEGADLKEYISQKGFDITTDPVDPTDPTESYPLFNLWKRENEIKPEEYYFGDVFLFQGLLGYLVPLKDSPTGLGFMVANESVFLQKAKELNIRLSNNTFALNKRDLFHMTFFKPFSLYLREREGYNFRFSRKQFHLYIQVKSTTNKLQTLEQEVNNIKVRIYRITVGEYNTELRLHNLFYFCCVIKKEDRDLLKQLGVTEEPVNFNKIQSNINIEII